MTDDLEKTLMPQLRELTGFDYYTLGEWHDVCFYFSHAKADGKVYDAMKFQLTDEQYNQCELLHNRHMYAGNEITHDLSYMRSMHFLKMLVELSKIV